MSLPALLIAAFLAGLSFGGAGVWRAQAWRHDSAALKAQQQAATDGRRTAAQIDRAAEAFQARQEAADAREAELESRTYAEVQKPDSRSACLSDDGLRILRDAAAASNARRGIAAALPAASNPN